MVKGETWTYKPLSVKRQHASTMKVIVACLFGVVVLTGITGHLFRKREATTTTPPPSNPHHEALAKLIRTSEDAIGWIGNKTIDSINNIKNLTALVVTPESPLVVQKNKFLNWIRGVSNYNSSTSGAESPETEVPEDSGESVVIAHRTPGHGFSWGPPQDNRTASAEGRVTPSPPGPLHAAGRRAHSLLSSLYQTSRNISQRGKDILQSGIDKSKESLKTKLIKIYEKYFGEHTTTATTTTTTTTTASALDGPCEDVTDKVCAVDWDRNIFTIFQNDCWARVYNQLHGTSFIIHDSDVCINLFADRPENYQKIENIVM